jgi:hypothetical protein
MKYSTHRNLAALALIVVIAIVAVWCGGCSGVAVNANVGTVFSVGATNATVQLPQAQAGTLAVATARDACIDAGERFKTAQANLANAWTYITANKTHGMMIIDQTYVPAFNAICADSLAICDRWTGAWATTPPDLATANAAAAQCLKGLLVCHAMIIDKTSQTVSLKKPVKAIDITKIINAIGGQAVWAKLTPAQQAAVEADAAAVTAWLTSNATSQFAAWWANISSGNTIDAMKLVRDSQTDAALIATASADNAAGVDAVANHVLGQKAFVAVLQQIGADIVAAIPAILALLGL